LARATRGSRCASPRPPTLAFTSHSTAAQQRRRGPLPLAVPDLGSSGSALEVEVGPLGTPPLPRVLEPAASNVTAVDHPGGARSCPPIKLYEAARLEQARA